VELNANWHDNRRPVEYVTRMLKQKENAAELRSSGAGLKFLLTVNDVLVRFRSNYLKYLKKVLPFELAQGVLAPIQTACVLAYVILFIIEGDITKIGLYASLTVASNLLASSLSEAAGSVNDILQFTLYGERIAAFFDAKSVIEPPNEGALSPPEGVYGIEFKDVSFGYDGAAFGIEHLNLRIAPGQRVAIVGENGAGKTTLTKLLLRLYDVSGGQVLVNGADIKEYDIHKLRLQIGVAFQDVRVLAMSLRDNLTVYNEVPDAQLLEVINKLGLDGVLEKAGGDLNKMVSREFTEDGVALSGGEAQRLTLARLFTGPFGLLVLDEPSSALDPLAEYKLMQIILDASNTATTVMIAHRLSTVRDFDVIYHMEDGAILESGTHNELMAARGKYYEMFTRQAENYQSA
jgi:ATP-binding cassette subfamily B protein